MKRIEIIEDGRKVFYRMRRGRLVRIPDEWVGRVAHPQNIRTRDSKIEGSLQRTVKDWRGVNRYKDRRQALKVSDY